MATHTINKASYKGIGYSIVELNDVRHVFAAGAPERGGSLREQAEDALQTIERVLDKEGGRRAIVQQAVFLPDVSLIEPCRRIMRDFYGDELPATSYVPQPPGDDKLVAIEALGVGQSLGKVEIQRISEQLVITRHNDIAWVHCAQVVPRRADSSVYDGTIDGLEQIRALLASVNVRFDQVIRTWLYLGGIVDDEGPTQRYKELNRGRSDVYADIHFLADRVPSGHRARVYPASTGIGTEGRGIMMSAIALATDRSDILAVPLENPRQTPAFDYSDCYSPKSPKFCRAMALSCGNYATIFISGTASITDSETRHIDDIKGQTNETLDNIAALISEQNLSRHGLAGLGTSLDGLGLIRVYIKNRADYAQARAVCEQRLGELPVIYVIGDVCRPDLLVEIEGVAFSRNATAPASDVGHRQVDQLRWKSTVV